MVLTDQLHIGTGGSGDLTAAADFHLHIVDDGADRYVAHGQGVARLDIDPFTGNDGVARLQTLRRQDVGLLTVFVGDQGDKGASVRIIFKTFYGRRHVITLTLKINHPVAALVAATPAAHGDPALIVAATLAAQTFGQAFLRLTGPQIRLIDEHKAPPAGGCGFVILKCHNPSPAYTPVVISMESPSASVTMAFLVSTRLPILPRNRFTFPF